MVLILGRQLCGPPMVKMRACRDCRWGEGRSDKGSTESLWLTDERNPRVARVYVGDEPLGLWHSMVESGRSELLLSLFAAL